MLNFDELKNCKDERAKESVDFYLSEAEENGLSFYADVFADCLLIMGRDEDGTVFFPPEALCDTADVGAALDAIDEFAGAACIERVFVGLDADCEDGFSLRYRDHETTDMGDGFSGFRVLTELHHLEKIEKITGDAISLSQPQESDRAFFAALIADTKASQYGYGSAQKDLYEEVVKEWEDRSALSLVIRKDETAVGEITLFSFDGRKTAKLAVRILSEYRRLGYAKEALREITAFCRDVLRLEKLKAEVVSENAPSLCLFSSFFIREKEKNGVVSFYRNL